MPLTLQPPWIASFDAALWQASPGDYGLGAFHNGATVWSASLPMPVEASPTVADNVVFAAHASGVSALHVTSCQTLWSVATSQPVTSTLTVCGSLVVFGCRDRLIRAVQADDGALLWSFATGGFVEGGTAFEGATIFVGSDDGTLYAFRLDGATLWNYAGIGEIKSMPLLVADLVIFGSAQGVLTALEMVTGVVRWQKQMPSGFTTNSATLHVENFLIGDEAGFVHCIAGATGTIAWTTQQNLGPLRNKIALNGDLLFVGSLFGSVFLLDIWTGSVLHAVSAGSPVVASPVATPDAVIVVTQ